MAAYVISEVEPLDAALIERYRALAADSIARHGGRYIVRGGTAECLEGGPSVKTLVIVEFASMAQARGWYASADYAEALSLRRAGALERRLVFVEGVKGEVSTILCNQKTHC
jgi:uncharacterized protein (DUF1330 family)